jgi:hypothetical protein
MTKTDSSKEKDHPEVPRPLPEILDITLDPEPVSTKPAQEMIRYVIENRDAINKIIDYLKAHDLQIHRG